MEAVDQRSVRFQKPLTSIRSTECFIRSVECKGSFLIYACCGLPVDGTLDCFHCVEETHITSIEPKTERKPYTRRSVKLSEQDDGDDEDNATDEAEAAELYDEGCSMAHCSDHLQTLGSSPEMSQQDEQAGTKHDASLHQNILAARKNGLLPLEVKISLFADTSFYTEEELEQMAVDFHLRRELINKLQVRHVS